MSGDLFLGECLFEPRPYSRVEPIAVAQKGVWRAYDDWANALPPDGKAFAPALPGFHARQLVVFRVVRNERDEVDKDQFLVSQPVHPTEVLDYRRVDPEDARRALVEEGLRTAGSAPFQVVAALRDDRCAVVRMVRHPDGERHVADLAGLERLPVHALDPRIFESGKTNGKFYVVPDETVGAEIGTVDWSPDTDFLQSILKRLRRAAPAGGEVSPFSRTQIDQLVGYLTRARLLPNNREDPRASSARLARFTAELAANAKAFEDLVEVVAALRPVREGLDERRRLVEEQLREELEPRVRVELEAAHAELASARDALAAETQTLVRVADEARTTAKAEEKALAAVRKALSDELLAVLQAATEDSSLQAAEVARGLNSALPTRDGVPLEAWPSRSPPWTRPGPGIDEKALPWKEFATRLKAAAEHFGLAPEEVAWADVAARSGRLVLLPDNECADLVQCHAAALANGRVMRHVLDPTVLGLDDLWRRPVDGQPTAFALAWTAARADPHRFQFVVLDGLHRTPLDFWAPGLICLLDGPQRPANLLVYGTYGIALVDPARAWPSATIHAVALDPSAASRINGAVLDAAVARPSAATWFDVEQAEEPPETELLMMLAKLASDAPAQAVRRGLRAVRAAWPLLGELDPVQVAQTFSTGDYLAPALERGAARARAVLEPSSS